MDRRDLKILIGFCGLTGAMMFLSVGVVTLLFDARHDLFIRVLVGSLFFGSALKILLDYLGGTDAKVARILEATEKDVAE